MVNSSLLQCVEQRVKALSESDTTGHDWWHIDRVRNLARTIAITEGADTFIVELSALLHDVADWKFHGGDHRAGGKKVHEILSEYGVAEHVISRVAEIVDNVSFKGAGVLTPMFTLEGKVVQDADRLDAIGAIGIARTFAYGGSKNRLMYHPDIRPIKHANFDKYKASEAPTINHFYEKLLLLKDRMQTETAKSMAEERHRYMEHFLAQFFDEWKGKR